MSRKEGQSYRIKQTQSCMWKHTRVYLCLIFWTCSVPFGNLSAVVELKAMDPLLRQSNFLRSGRVTPILSAISQRCPRQVNLQDAGFALADLRDKAMTLPARSSLLCCDDNRQAVWDPDSADLTTAHGPHVKSPVQIGLCCAC